MPDHNNITFNHYLAPFSFLYGIGVSIRNKLFDWGILKSKQYPVPVICIGNLAVGGTGKTPHTEYLIRLLRKKYRLAVLSRGYKRKTSGFILADEKSQSNDIGDEPYQIKMKFPDILVAVDSNRRRGIEKLLALSEETRPEVILLDDAFQHRYVSPSLSIILTDYNRLIYNDKLLPTGRLRESMSGLNRCDIVLITKCAEGIKPIEYRIMEENMKLKAHQQLFFTQIGYNNIEPVFPEHASSIKLTELESDSAIIAISGIAAPELFLKEVERYSSNVCPLIFPDHHDFGKNDIKKIDTCFQEQTNKQVLLLTTEKDAARLKNDPQVPERWKKSLYYLPIGIQFCGENRFDEIITKHIHNIHRNSILRKQL